MNQTIRDVLIFGGTAIAVASIFMVYLRHLRDKVKESYESGFEDGRDVSDQSFLYKDEKTVAKEKEIEEKIKCIDSAKSSLSMLIVNGGDWLNELIPSLQKAKKKGVTIEVLIMHPSKEMVKYISNMEPVLTRDHYYRSQAGDEEKRSKQILETVNKLEHLADIRCYDRFPFWRGIIADGEIAIYRYVNVPRFGWKVPELSCDNANIVSHLKKNIFEPYWKDSTKITHDTELQKTQ